VDIAISLINLLHAIFDIDSDEDEEYLKLIIKAMIKAEGLPILVEAFSRFDENEVFHIFGSVPYDFCNVGNILGRRS
jgi:hypothetical protein